MSEVQNQKTEEESLTKILFDISSEEGHSNKVHVEGRQDVIISVLKQVFAHPGHEGIHEVFALALEEYYQENPDKRIIF